MGYYFLPGNRTSRRAFVCMASNLDGNRGTRNGGMLVAALMRERTSIQQVSWRPETTDRFPVDAMGVLHEMGLLAAPLPMREGGLGWGTEEAGIAALCSAFQIIGYGSLALGRIYEAHVNAIALIFHYGDVEVRATARVGGTRRRAFRVVGNVRPGTGSSDRRSSTCHAFRTQSILHGCRFPAKWALITALDEQSREQMFLVPTAQLEIDDRNGGVLGGMREARRRSRFHSIARCRRRIGLA